MTDFTPEQLKKIEAAFDNHDNKRIGQGAATVSHVKDWLIAELTRPAQTFEVGQWVIYAKQPEISQPFIWTEGFNDVQDMRVATPAECGPHVVKLLEALKRISHEIEVYGIKDRRTQGAGIASGEPS